MKITWEICRENWRLGKYDRLPETKPASLHLQNGRLEDDPFLLGFGLFSGATC